ncbi:MAG TPA: glycosyltransferase 87 family protein [Candidatus Tumulicola sp.]
MTTRRIVIAIGLLSLAIAAGFDLSRLRGAAPARNMIDLSIFYCAGRAVLHRQNPYALESIRPCEHRLSHGPAWNDPAYVMPAPLPPFAFPPYAALSRLDYGAAKGVAGVAIAAAVVVAALALADIGIPFAAALAALALADGFVGLFLGQVYPFTIALLALTAAALRRERDGLAGFFAALTLIQPQIGIPICVSLLIWAARARIALAAWAVALTIAGVSIVGIGAFVQWATQVIPGEARAEVFFWGQYSLTSVLASLGVGTGTALLAGSASFVVMLAVATLLAKRLAERLHAREYLVLVPPALCVIGGTFVHLASMAAAIPLALALTIAPAYSTSRWRVLAPLLLLAIPWPFAQAVKALFFSCVLVAAVILVSLRANARAGTALLLATAAGVYLIALATPPPAPIAIVAGSVDPWRELAKLPSWIGLIALLAAAIKVAARNAAPA